MSDYIVSTMNMINPYRFWTTVVYDNISGSNVEYVICYDCFIMLHYDSKFDIVVSSVGNTTVANTTANNNAWINDFSNWNYDAETTANAIFNNDCVYGVHVIERYVDEWIYTFMGNRVNQVVGDNHTIVTWAINDFCESMQGTKTPMTSGSPNASNNFLS